MSYGLSKLRPETIPGGRDVSCLSDAAAIDLILSAVAKREGLIHGHLTGSRGQHCAMGAFWADNPGKGVRTSLVDEVAAVNDSLPKNASRRERRKLILGWLRQRKRAAK